MSGIRWTEEELAAHTGTMVWHKAAPPTRQKYHAQPTTVGDDTLIRQCRERGLPEPVREFRFAPPRRWRFDFAWIDQRLALEVQGGLFVNGRHSRGAALLKEHEKLNAAAVKGYRVVFTTPVDVVNGKTMRWLAPLLCAKIGGADRC